MGKMILPSKKDIVKYALSIIEDCTEIGCDGDSVCGRTHFVFDGEHFAVFDDCLKKVQLLMKMADGETLVDKDIIDMGL